MSVPVSRLSLGGTPVLGFAACSGTGKTTLLTQLIPVLRDRGLRTGLVKHAHHRFEIDHEGKDSYSLRKAGASPVLVSSKERWALIHENDICEEPALSELVERVDSHGVDLILVEGFKSEALPKIELTRPALGRALMYPEDSDIVAIATDAPLPRDAQTTLPLLDLNDIDGIAEFVMAYVRDATR